MKEAILKTFLLFIALFFPTSQVFSRPAEEKLYKQCLHPTIRIIEPNKYCVGSAFIVRSELNCEIYHNVAITAAHCVTDGDYLVNIPQYNSEGKFLKYENFPAYVYTANKEDDLAVVLFKTQKKQPCVQWDFSDVKYAQEIFHIGFGLGDIARLDDGKITFPTNEGKIRTNAYTVAGDSGGPLFNKRNKVIGVCQSIRFENNIRYFQISFYTPVEAMKRWNGKTNNALSFVYNYKAELPTMAYILLDLKQYEIGERSDANLHCPSVPKTSP